MYLYTPLSIVIAAIFTAAAPVEFDYSNLEEITDPTLFDTASANYDKLEEAKGLTNQGLERMHDMLRAPNVGDNRQKIELAFGSNPNIPLIEAKVARMRDPRAIIPIKSLLSTLPEGVAAGSYVRSSKGQTKVRNGKVVYKNMGFGDIFFEDGFGSLNRAGAVTHEASHMLNGAGDAVVGPSGYPDDLKSALRQPQRLEIIDQHYPRLPNTKIWEGQGSTYIHYYLIADLMKNTNAVGMDESALHDEIVATKGAVIAGTTFSDVVEHTANSYDNADSYRALFALGFCRRSLYKRALTRRDPVGHYLAKRDTCTPRTAKTAPKTTNTKTVQGIPSKKASKILGAKERPNAANVAKRRQAATQAKKTKDPKDKTAKGPRFAKSQAAKDAKGDKTTKNTRRPKAGVKAKAGMGPKAVRKPLNNKAKKATKNTNTPKRGRGAKAGAAGQRGQSTEATKKKGGARGLRTATKAGSGPKQKAGGKGPGGEKRKTGAAGGGGVKAKEKGTDAETTRRVVGAAPQRKAGDAPNQSTARQQPNKSTPSSPTAPRMALPPANVNAPPNPVAKPLGTSGTPAPGAPKKKSGK